MMLFAWTVGCFDDQSWSQGKNFFSTRAHVGCVRSIANDRMRVVLTVENAPESPRGLRKTTLLLSPRRAAIQEVSFRNGEPESEIKPFARVE